VEVSLAGFIGMKGVAERGDDGENLQPLLARAMERRNNMRKGYLT
jgi:hypothetical protein